MIRSRPFRIAITIAFLLFFWYFLLPQKWGGKTSWITTTGNSMEPTLHQGDLVGVQSQAKYKKGDVVAYQSKLARVLVLHRIIGTDGDAFIFKGDHNNFTDSEHVTGDRLVGKMVYKLPKIGTTIAWLHSPKGMPALILATISIVLLTRARKKQQAGEKTGDDDDGDSDSDSTDATTKPLDSGAVPARTEAKAASAANPPKAAETSDSSKAAISAGSIVDNLKQNEKVQHLVERFNTSENKKRALKGAVIFFAALTLYGFVRPTYIVRSREFIYNQNGTFEYSARARGGEVVYANGEVETGDPIFTTLVDNVHLKFNYKLDNHIKGDITGTASLTVNLSDANGWSREIVVAKPKAFKGSETTIEGDVDLKKTWSYLNQVQELTDVPRAQFTFSIRPSVAITAPVGNRTLNEKFDPKLDFGFGPRQLTLTASSANNKENSLKKGKGGNIEAAVPVANYARFLILNVSPPGMRILGIFGIVICGGLFLRMRNPRIKTSKIMDSGLTGHELFKIKYAEYLMDIGANQLDPTQDAVPVSQMAQLVEIAKTSGSMILHTVVGSTHVYQLKSDGTTYRYSVEDFGFDDKSPEQTGDTKVDEREKTEESNDSTQPKTRKSEDDKNSKPKGQSKPDTDGKPKGRGDATDDDEDDE